MPDKNKLTELRKTIAMNTEHELGKSASFYSTQINTAMSHIKQELRYITGGSKHIDAIKTHLERLEEANDSRDKEMRLLEICITKL